MNTIVRYTVPIVWSLPSLRPHPALLRRQPECPPVLLLLSREGMRIAIGVSQYQASSRRRHASHRSPIYKSGLSPFLNIRERRLVQGAPPMKTALTSRISPGPSRGNELVTSALLRTAPGRQTSQTKAKEKEGPRFRNTRHLRVHRHVVQKQTHVVPSQIMEYDMGVGSRTQRRKGRLNTPNPTLLASV